MYKIYSSASVEVLKSLDLGLETRLTSKVGLLSGGQRQAVTLLMATLKKPKILLLDEHTAALDPKTAKKVLDLTEKIVVRLSLDENEGLEFFQLQQSHVDHDQRQLNDHFQKVGKE